MSRSPIFRRVTLTEVKKTTNRRGSLLKELAGLEKEEKDIIKNHYDPSYSNWRASFIIEDGMNTKGFMQQTFPAAGDTDFDSIDSTGDIEQFPNMTSNRDPAGPEGGNWPVQGVEILSSGSGSGDSGGFDIGTDYLAVNNAGGPLFNAINLDPIDCTKLDEIVITGIRGSGSNGGELPTDLFSSLGLIWQSPETIGDSGFPTWANMYNDASLNQVPEGTINEVYNEYNVLIPSSGSSKYDASHTGLREWTLPIPSWVRGENITFGLEQTIEGGLNYGITKIAFRRKSPISVFVSLDSPEAASFMRIGSPSKATDSKKKRERQLREQLEASKDYTDKKFGENFPGSEYSAPGEEDPTEVEKKAPRLGEFEPEVVDYNTWKQETKAEDPQAKTTPKEYEKWKDDKRLKSFAAVRDAQGEKETPLPSPTSDNKDFDTFSQGRTGQVMKDAQTNAVQNMGGVDKIPKDAPEEVKDLLTNKSPLKAVQNAITSFDKKMLDAYLAPDKALDAVVDTATGAVDAVAQGYEKAGVNKAGETFIKYLTNTLPDVLDNEYLGQKYVDQMIKQGAIDTDPDSPTYGTFQARENVIGGAQPPTYDPETGEISIKFNYDFKTNAQDFADKEAAGQEINPLSKLYHHSTGRYSSDASISSNIPILGGAINAVSGIVFGQLIDKAKGLGGGEGKPGEMTIDVEELKDKNYTMFMDLVRAGTIKNANEKIGEPAFTKTPQQLSQGERIAAAQKNANWKVLLKNLPSWFSTYGNPEVVEYRGVKGVWGNAYDGSKAFLVPTSERGHRGSSSSGYGTPGYDSATNTGGTLWQGLDADGPNGIDAFIDKHGLEPTQPVEWEGTPEQQENLYKDLTDLFDTDPNRAQEIMQQVEDNPEYKKISDEVEKLRELVQSTKGNRNNPIGSINGNYIEDREMEKVNQALTGTEYSFFKGDMKGDPRLKSVIDKYNAATNAYRKDFDFRNKYAGTSRVVNMGTNPLELFKKMSASANAVTKAVEKLAKEDEKKLNDLTNQQTQMLDRNLYNALNASKKDPLDGTQLAGAPSSRVGAGLPTGRGTNRYQAGDEGSITTDSDFGKRMRDAVQGMGNIKAQTPQQDFGSIAQTYGGQGVDAATLASTAAATQTKKKKKKTTVTASYKPKGSMISEKRKLKTPSKFFNSDDIKPEYPKDPPPKMINNYHPDLVDSARKAERFNKLDPASAKAMPKQDDPNIDAKVEKAKNNPDKDGPGWHKQVSNKIRMARAQQREG